MKRIIIDADPGIDDIFAILLAAKSSELKIEGITTVAGNCDLEHATNNAFKALDLANRLDIPVYKGEKQAINENNDYASTVHGNNGLGGIYYQPICKQTENKSATDYLIEEVNNNPGEIIIVAIGPLTNIAKAILKNKDFSKNVKDLIIMGGAAGKGNITPHAEFNFYKDPDAANIVFNANFKNIVMIGLDVTTKLPLNEKLEKILLNMNSDLADFLFKITRTGADFDRKLGWDGCILNDPLTIAYLLDENIIELKNAHVTIETSGEKIGKSNVSFIENSNCQVTYEVNPDKFYNILFKKIFNIEIETENH